MSGRSQRRGRGARISGRGGLPGGPPPVEEVVAHRGGPSRRPRASRGVRALGGDPPPINLGVEATGRGRGRGRGGAPRLERPGPYNIDELVTHDILEMPEGRGLETALHPKRMRMWQPSIGQSSTPRPSPVPSTSNQVPGSSSQVPGPSSQVPGPSSQVPGPSSQVPGPSSQVPGPSSQVPGPSSQVQVPGPSSQVPGPSSPTPPTPFHHPPPRRHPQNLLNHLADLSDLVNYGSEYESSSDDDDEEGVAIYGIPRVIRSILETPLDVMQDDLAPDAVDVPAADEVLAADEVPEDVPLSATDQPRRWYDFEWSNFPDSPISPESRREKFSQINVGPTTPRDDPYDVFVDIWDRQIMEHIALETNRYAQVVAAQLMNSNNIHPKSRICQWTDTNVDELYVYFGLVLAMGIVVKSNLAEYWSSTPDVFYTPGFSAHMSIDRFILLSKCLHFANNEVMCALELGSSEAKLFKIQPIVSHLQQKFQELYTPSQNIALDESLLMWKGWLQMSQLIPNKAAKRGVKTYEVCESQTGYLFRFEVHAHKKQTPQTLEDPLEASTPSIVLKLIEGLEHKGYTLWMDNFYNSPCLARRLKCLGFDCVGTLRTDRKFVPQALHSSTKRNMRPGQITGLTSGDVDIMVWRDTNRVSMISTYHGPAQHTVRGSTKPILILDYN